MLCNTPSSTGMTVRIVCTSVSMACQDLAGLLRAYSMKDDHLEWANNNPAWSSFMLYALISASSMLMVLLPAVYFVLVLLLLH